MALAEICNSTTLQDGMYAQLNTSKGEIIFRLFYQEAPLTVSNFIALAQGKIQWKDPVSGVLKKEPFYEGLKFHRIIPDFMAQSGDPRGNGHGGPGYQLVREIHPRLKHDSPGVLSMLNKETFSHGSQFFITLKEAPFLDGKHAVFGKAIKGLDVLPLIEQEDTIYHVVIIRQGKLAEAFDIQKYLGSIQKHMADMDEKKMGTPSKKESRKARNLPQPTGNIDPAAIPEEGQPAADKIALEYILITHEGSMFPSARSQNTKAEAYETAKQLTQLAREKNRSFRQLAVRFSDSTEFRIPLLTRSRLANSSYKPCFFLKEGQISDPVDLPEGYAVFRRTRLDIIKVQHILIAHAGGLLYPDERAGDSTLRSSEKKLPDTTKGKKQLRTKKEARELADTVLKKALAGESFAALAETYSDSASAQKGGHIGEVAKGMTIPPFDHAAFRLKINEISPVIPTPAGFQIIKRIE
jgi:peptidylprolyl isomerase